MTDKQQLRDLFKRLGLDNKKVAEITGFKESYVKNIMQKNKAVPRWCRLLMWREQFILDEFIPECNKCYDTGIVYNETHGSERACECHLD